MIKLIEKQYDINKLGAGQKQSLARHIFPVIEEVSPGETLDDFVKDYNQPHVYNAMAVYETEEGQAAGYVRYKVDQIWSEGLDYLIARLDVTIKPAFRGSIPLGRFIIKEGFLKPELYTHPRFFACLLCASPAPYYTIANVVPDIYPHPAKRDSKCETLLAALIQAQGLKGADGCPYAIQLFPTGFIESEAEREGWRRHPSPFVQLYLRECPRYAEGQAMVALVRLSPAMFVRSALKHGADRILKGLGIRESSRKQYIPGS